MAIAYAREKTLSEDEYISVLRQTTMADRRPLTDQPRIRDMLDGANFIVTARDENGTLIGLARCICDFAWVCYCADLAVSDTHQGQGIGKGLLDKCTELLGPSIGLCLIAYPEAVGFYQRIDMEPVPGFFRARSDR